MSDKEELRLKLTLTIMKYGSRVLDVHKGKENPTLGELVDKPVDEIIDLIESVVDNLKPDTNLLGCDKHWSDDSGGTCTCDENERTAIRFYEKAKDDIKSKLIGKE